MKKSHRQRGATIAEIVIVIFLIGLIGVAISSFQLDLVRTSGIISNNLTAQDEARRALRRMDAELRTASPSNLGAYPLTQVATSSITFFSDTNGDLLKEQIRYYISGTTLKRGAIKPTGTPLTYNSANETFSELVHNVRNATSSPIFFYYDTNYDGTTASLASPVNIAVVRLIKIALTIDNDTKKLPPAMTITTQISMRNLKDNL